MYIASASTTVKLHDFSNGNIVYNYQPGTRVEGSIRSISWSKDGCWLILVPYAGLTEIVAVQDQLKFLRTIPDVEEPTCATFQNTTKRFVGMGTRNGQVLVFDIKAKSIKKRFNKANSHITQVEFTAKDSHCVASCKSGDVLVYNNITNSPPSLLKVPKSSSISCLKTHKIKQNLIVGGSNEGIVCVWDNNTSRTKFVKEAHKAPVNSVTFSPINSDLIVTTGSDRQCYYFDIKANQLIYSFTAENSVTSIDFSHDGTFIAMASQKGNISIYDTRRFDKPVLSFHAHASSIKQILFQNCSNSENASSCNLSVDSSPTPSDENLCNATRPKRTSDIFRTFIPSVDTNDGITEIFNRKNSTAVIVEDTGDSFLAALGLDHNTTYEYSKNDDSVFSKYPPPKLPPSVVEIIETDENKNGAVQSEADSSDIENTSTPVLPRRETYFIEKPNLIGVVQGQINTEKNDVSGDLQIIRQEMQELTNDLRHEIKSEATTIRKMLIDTQMAMVRESLKMEDWCNKLREEINGENGRDINTVLNENERLRKRVQFLEDQVKNASTKSDSSIL